MEGTEKIWQLIAKSLSGEISTPERAELTQLLQQDAALSQQFELLTRIWKEHPGQPDDLETAQQDIYRIISRADLASAGLNDEQQTRVRRRRRWGLVLGISAIAVAAWLGLSGDNGWSKGSAPKAMADLRPSLVVPQGARSTTKLRDGSVVWLNAGSKLYYVNDFKGATREVRLEGEGYFDVTHDASRPFLVHVNGYEVKVLGTVFNIKAYASDHNMETTLFHGSVTVFRENGPESAGVQLRPNQKLIIPSDSESVSTEQWKYAPQQTVPDCSIIAIDSNKAQADRPETAWMFSRLEFRGEDFAVLAPRLERWFDIRIRFSDDGAAKLKFNGSFEKENVEQAFGALRAASPLFNYIIRGNEVTIGSAN